jgi:hypothetical protein
LECAGDLGKAHLFDVLIGEVVEEALDGGEDFLSRLPFALAVLGGAAGPIGGSPGLSGGLGMGLLLEETRVCRIDQRLTVS